MGAERIRVFIAGNIYVKRALVRRFLEDDGFDVVGEARTREDMVEATRREQPDALVVDDELLVDGPGGGTMGRIRRAAPDAKVVVFTSTPVDPATAPSDADGYLEKGLGLASLTALLGRLFAEPAVAPSNAALAETATLAALAQDDEPVDDAIAIMTDRDEDTTGQGAAAASTRSGGASRLVAMVAGVVLIVWGVGAMIGSGRGDAPTRALDTTDRTDGSVVDATTNGAKPLPEGHALLDEMIGALESGNYVLAAVDARALMELRDEARGAGFALTGIDAAIVARLDAVAVTIPTRVATALAAILGDLYPTPEVSPVDPTSPSDVVLEPATERPIETATDPTPATSPVDGKDTTRDPAPAPDPPQAPAPAPEPPQTPQPAPPQPGDGRTWGQSHNPHGGPPGQTTHHGPTERQKRNHDGGKPPWAGGD